MCAASDYESFTVLVLLHAMFQFDMKPPYCPTVRYPGYVSAHSCPEKLFSYVNKTFFARLKKQRNTHDFVKAEQELVKGG